MLNDIVLNRYINNKTFIHDLNTVNKLLTIPLFILITINTKSIYYHFVYLIYLLFLIVLSKVSFKKYIKSLKYVLYLMGGIFLINIIFNTPIIDNIVNILRIIEIVIYSSIITMTTSESEMLDGISIILKPLKIFKININKLSLIFTLTIRFIPIIIDQINKIIKTLLSKGINFKKNIVLILKSIIIPTFSLSIKKADDLSESMEVRMYNINNYEKKIIYNKWNIKDLIIIIIYILILIGVIICDI